MKQVSTWLSAVVVLAAATFVHAQEGAKKVAGPLQFKLKNIDGNEVDLAKYRGTVVLIVNVASECGYTPQYKGLQALHAKYRKDGLAILGIPSNDFGMQEPGSEKQIKAFCEKNYGVTFDLFAKVGIAGEDAHPLYKHLTSKKTNPNHAGPVSWNFEKFLIGRDGQVIARFAADVDPESEDFEQALRQALQKK
jgi:glutathione peroxidase